MACPEGWFGEVSSPGNASGARTAWDTRSLDDRSGLWPATHGEKHLAARAPWPSMLDDLEAALLEEPLPRSARMEAAHHRPQERGRPYVGKDEEPATSQDPRHLPHAPVLVAPVVGREGAERDVYRTGLQGERSRVAHFEVEAGGPGILPP